MVDIKELRVKNLASCKDLQIKDEKGVIQKIDQLNIDGRTLLNVKINKFQNIIKVDYFIKKLKNSLENLLKKPTLKHNVTFENAANVPIVEFPPKMETLGCKPIFFDLVN